MVAAISWPKSHRSRLEAVSQAVAVCASTGVAAIPLNGCTVHSFLGCGRGSDEEWQKARQKKQAARPLVVHRPPGGQATAPGAGLSAG